MASIGRPSKYSEDLAAQICLRLSEGESLRAICRDDAMPDKATVFRWLADEKRQSFRDQYARARDAQTDHFADEILEIADDGSNDWMERFDKDGEKSGWQLNGEHVQRSRVRIDTRKWLMARMSPRKYGDRVAMEHSGPDGGPIEHDFVGEFARRIAGVAARLGAEEASEGAEPGEGEGAS